MPRRSRSIQPDPCPHLLVERGPKDAGVGLWVPEQKHRLLEHYLYASRHAWRKWPNRIFIDPFAGPGRIQVKGESFTRDGGAVAAWRALADTAPFTKMLIGDISAERSSACATRLTALGANVERFVGPAVDTVPGMVELIPAGSLCIAYIDPYNLELLTFTMIEEISKLSKVDLAINFSTMDLERNLELEFDPERGRFDGAAPGWRRDGQVLAASRQNVKRAFFSYWCGLIRSLGFDLSKEMPLVTNDSGRGIYRMVFFARNDLPTRIWGDVARGPNLDLELL